MDLVAGDKAPSSVQVGAEERDRLPPINQPQDSPELQIEEDPEYNARKPDDIEAGKQTPSMSSPELKGHAETAKGTAARLDRYGVPIVKPGARTLSKVTTNSGDKLKDKGDKIKHKVSFVDKVEKEGEMVSTTYVLSYKKYNSMNTFDPAESEPEESGSHCCAIF